MSETYTHGRDGRRAYQIRERRGREPAHLYRDTCAQTRRARARTATGLTVRDRAEGAQHGVPVEEEHVLGVRRGRGPDEPGLVRERQRVVVQQQREADGCMCVCAERRALVVDRVRGRDSPLM